MGRLELRTRREKQSPTLLSLPLPTPGEEERYIYTSIQLISGLINIGSHSLCVWGGLQIEGMQPVPHCRLLELPKKQVSNRF